MLIFCGNFDSPNNPNLKVLQLSNPVLKHRIGSLQLHMICRLLAPIDWK